MKKNKGSDLDKILNTYSTSNRGSANRRTTATPAGNLRVRNQNKTADPKRPKSIVVVACIVMIIGMLMIGINLWAWYVYALVYNAKNGLINWPSFCVLWGIVVVIPTGYFFLKLKEAARISLIVHCIGIILSYIYFGWSMRFLFTVFEGGMHSHAISMLLILAGLILLIVVFIRYLVRIHPYFKDKLTRIGSYRSRRGQSTIDR